METPQEQIERPNFDTVWAGLEKTNATLDKIAQQQKENAEQLKETDRIIKETARRQEETDREIKETARIAKENDKRIGELSNRFGEMVEYMVVPNLLEKFQELGFVFDKVHQNTAITDRKNNIFTEVDITLENGDDVMITEVKSKPGIEDINRHIKRMEKVKTHARFHGDTRKYLGAVAGVVMMPGVKEYTLEQGFYVIEPSGETFNITPPSQPKKW
jgi:predicted GNAT family acetyltransferase